jgi:hypothetical protein
MTAPGWAGSGPLVWKQSAATQRHYELRAGETTVAELDFLKAFGTLARGRAASGVWTFKRTGFLSPIVTARREGESEDCAFYHPNFSASQGQLRLASGEAFEFRLAGIWARSAILIDNDRREVFRVHLKGESGAGATVEVRLPETPGIELLLLLCWYVLVLQMQDESLRSAAR